MEYDTGGCSVWHGTCSPYVAVSRNVVLLLSWEGGVEDELSAWNLLERGRSYGMDDIGNIQ